MQPVPEEYEPLEFVGFTDRGIWSSTETYIENDIVHKDNIAWRCLIDDTIGITPAEGDNWTLFMDSTSPFYGAYDTFPVPGEPGRFYIDNTVDPRLMYTWDHETQKYILTGGAGGADGGSVDIPITLTSAGWTGTTAPYQQTITLPQMREGMTPLFFLASDGDDAQYAFSLITGYQSGYAEITFYAADKPTIDLSLTLKGIPAQEMEYVDNTVVFLVEPSAFTQNEETQRYEATIDVPGMTEGTGGIWDIVRSGPDLTVAESKIALSITDVDRQQGSVKITCLEVPEQRYMMSIAGAYPDAEPGTVILAGMQEWFDRVEALFFKSGDEFNASSTYYPGIINGDGSGIIFSIPLSKKIDKNLTLTYKNGAYGGYVRFFDGDGVNNVANIVGSINVVITDNGLNVQLFAKPGTTFSASYNNPVLVEIDKIFMIQ